MTETGAARDLMRSAEIKEIVRSAYAAVDASSETVAQKLYSPEELAQVPQSAIEGALGVGNHLRHAEIAVGDTLVDLGCGAGIDTILAAQLTGPSGRVIALDFLPDMLERTRAAAAEIGLTNIEPLQGDIEAIPLPDASVDHIISNGVVNLAPAEGTRACRMRPRAPTRRQDHPFRPHRRRGRPPTRDPQPPGHLGRLSGRRADGA
jgi:arsenite methyltransferase